MVSYTLWTLDTDSRMAAQSTVRTVLAAYSFDRRHFHDPSPDQDIWQPPRLYVREYRRIAGDYVHTSDDLAMGDGSTPRSTNIIGAVSYNIDSHTVTRLAAVNLSPPQVWNEGGVGSSGVGGVDRISPLPMEAFFPKVAECTNLQVIFGASMTRPTMAGYRLEMPFMQIGQSSAHIADTAITGGTTVQAVPYATVRSSILAAPYPVVAVIPQVN